MDLTNEKLARRFLRGVSLGALAQHLILALLFCTDAVWLMVAVNLVCALIAGASLWLLNHEFPRAHMLAVYIAQLLCLCFSAVCVGWSAGFQLPLVGLTLLLFFAEYLARTTGGKYLPALPLAIVNFAVFLVVFAPRFRSPGLLSEWERLSVAVQLIWSGIVFALCIAGVAVAAQVNSDSERILIDQAESDKLTGLYNRTGYEQLLSRLDLNGTALLLVDADKFKHVNDTYGHSVGDQVLKKISSVLRGNFRRIDPVCRIGGDEFVVLMQNAEGMEREVIARKAARINRELSHTEDKLPLASVSIGVAFGCEAESWKELFQHADAALYEVKKNGGRDCRFYRDNENT